MGRVWSPQQEAVFAELRDGFGHSVVIARAGTGKTTTIAEALNRLPYGVSALIVAFNKRIASELQTRQARGEIRSGVDIKTTHGFGFGICKRNYGSELVEGQTDTLIATEHGDKTREYRVALAKVVSFSKSRLVCSREAVERVVEDMLANGQLEVAWENTAMFASDVLNILVRACEFPHTIDFDDMVYLPAMLEDIAMRQYDFVFVDETQDLNEAQVRLAIKACCGRVCAVGDPAQAIYAFRGADRDAIPKLVQELAAKTLSLSVTYRCASNIVEVAQRVVPDYTAAPGAPQGSVRNIAMSEVANLARPGDFVLSRTNAPLLGVWLGLLQANVPCTLAGGDVGPGLRALVARSGQRTIPSFTRWLDVWQATEISRLRERLRNAERAIASVTDRVNCLHVLMEGLESLDALYGRIGMLFEEAPEDNQRVVCSSVHKAKGLERERVFVLRDTFKLGGKDVEEDNLWYVAVTRAKSELFIVHDEKA